MKKNEYQLEIYEPGSARDVLMFFSSELPFMNLNKGDIVNPGIWTKTISPMKVLRIRAIEHLIWETTEAIKHKIMIYSEEVDGTENLRKG
jgi:hypothetical protein